LEAHAKLDAGSGAEEAMTVNKILVARADLDRDNVAWDASSKGNLTGSADRSVLGHEERAAASDARYGSEETTAAGVLGVSGHLDGGRHPGEFAGLGDHGIIGPEGEFKDRHGGAEDAILHDGLSCSDEEKYTWPKTRLDHHPFKKS
jgi:hypothetical protein